MWNFDSFSTGPGEDFFVVIYPQKKIPHSTTAVEKLRCILFLSPNKKRTRIIYEKLKC